MRLQLPLIIPVDDRAVLGDDEGVGVVFADDGAQAADLVFRDENKMCIRDRSCEGFSFLRGSGGSLRRFYICPLILSSLCAA